MKQIIVLLFIALAVTGCGKSKGGPSTNSKSLFSLWTASDNSQLDLRLARFGTQQMQFPHSSNAGCNCRLRLQGDDADGTAIIDNCTQYGPGPNQCAVGATHYTYTNVSAILNLCEAGTCTTYR